MPRGRESKHQVESSSSSNSEDEIFINIKQKKHQRHHSVSSSSSSSCSELEHYSNKQKECKKDKKKCSDSSRKSSRKCSKKNSKKCRRNSSSSETEHKDKCSFEDVYKYYKYRLLTDDHLMAGGSTAYTYAYNNQVEVIPRIYEIPFTGVGLNNNIQHLYNGSPFYVRESGVYVLFFAINSSQSSQFAIYVNGISQDVTRCGNNAGVGQLVVRCMLRLKKDDAVVIRNSESTSNAIESNLYMGGLQPGNGAVCLMFKIAPYERIRCDEWNEECLSRRKKFLFKKLLEKMLCDKDLMLKGFNTHGTFYTTALTTVATEADVPFEYSQHVSNLSWSSSSSPEQIKILEDGIYKVFFLIDVTTTAQISFAVNGNPIDITTMGINRGASQLSIRALLELKKGDVLTVKNHTSTNGNIVASQNAGGFQTPLNSILTISKISPLCKKPIDECKLNSYHKKCYEQFRSFLLHQKDLQIAGSSSYFSVSSDVKQDVPSSSAFDWTTNIIMENVWHHQGTPTFKIEEDGIYDIFADICTDQPLQFTLFINNSPDASTTSGRESGGSRCLMRQFVKLSKGDVLSIKNYESHAGTVTTTTNAGGNLVGQSCLFMAFKLSPICDKPNPPPKPNK